MTLPPDLRLGRPRAPQWPRRQAGATLVEFTLVAPVITLVGLLCLQWALSFHGRNQLQLAGFMAARAGATAQAQPAAIEEAHARALAPLYGGGRSLMEVEGAVLRARADLAGRVRIEIINPSVESFADWSDAALQARLQAPRRVIPNDGLALLAADEAQRVGPRSGQTLADANQLKLRITTGLPLQVPFASVLVRQVLQWSDDGRDAFVSGLLADGRMPMTVDVMVRMQSPAMESDATASVLPSPGGVSAGTGVGGSSSDASPAARGESVPAVCSTLGCQNPDGRGWASQPSASLALAAPPATASTRSQVEVRPESPAGATAGPRASGDPLFCLVPD